MTRMTEVSQNKKSYNFSLYVSAIPWEIAVFVFNCLSDTSNILLDYISFWRAASKSNLPLYTNIVIGHQGTGVSQGCNMRRLLSCWFPHTVWPLQGHFGIYLNGTFLLDLNRFFWTIFLIFMLDLYPPQKMILFLF